MSQQLLFIIIVGVIYIMVGSYCLATLHRRRWLCAILQFSTGFALTYVILSTLVETMSGYWFGLCFLDGILNIFSVKFYGKGIRMKDLP